MPQLQRAEPPYLQIAHYYQQRILSGDIPSKTKLPSMREIAGQWGVAPQTVQRAMEWLKVTGLVYTSPNGTFTNGGNSLKPTPHDRLTSVAWGGPLYPRGERIEPHGAEHIEAPLYITQIFGLSLGDGIVRREQIAYENGNEPCMLSVSWYPTDLLEDVPELLNDTAHDNGGMISLIVARTGRDVVHTEESYRARAILDDGREGPLLRLPKGSPCLAGVYLWTDSTDVLEYGEFVLPPEKVITYQRDL